MTNKTRIFFQYLCFLSTLWKSSSGGQIPDHTILFLLGSLEPPWNFSVAPNCHLCLWDIFLQKSPTLLSAFPTSLSHECVWKPIRSFLSYSSSKTLKWSAIHLYSWKITSQDGTWCSHSPFCLYLEFDFHSRGIFCVTWLAGPKIVDRVFSTQSPWKQASLGPPSNTVLPFWMKSLLREPGLNSDSPKILWCIKIPQEIYKSWSISR